MTEEQWATELAEHLRGSDWVIERSGVTRINHIGVALVRHSLTGHTVQIAVSHEDAGSPAGRREESWRQVVSCPWVFKGPASVDIDAGVTTLSDASDMIRPLDTLVL